MPPIVSLSPFRRHVANWGSCTRCPLSEGRRRVVLSRGTVPCDVLFLGEAPGESEDALGVPFAGPAGYLLDDIIRRADPRLGRAELVRCAACGKDVTDLVYERQTSNQDMDGRRVVYQGCSACPGRPRAVRSETGIPIAFTNLVCCIPRDEDGKKTAEPDPDEIMSCAPRLEEFVALANPRLIVCVGALSEAWVMGSRRGKRGARSLLKQYGGALVMITHPAAILRANVAQQGLMVQRAVVTVQNAVEELGLDVRDDR